MTSEKDEIEFKHFKLLVLGLFGINLLDLTQIDIDSILRKVYKELILVQDPDQKAPAVHE